MECIKMKIIKIFCRDVFFAAVILLGFGILGTTTFNDSLSYAYTAVYVGTMCSIIFVILYLICSILEVILSIKKKTE